MWTYMKLLIFVLIIIGLIYDVAVIDPSPDNVIVCFAMAPLLYKKLVMRPSKQPQDFAKTMSREG